MRRQDQRLVGAFALAALAALGASAPARAPAWIWNASASVPEGLYRVRPAPPLQVGDLVAAAPPEPLASFLAARRYLPRGAVLVKPVAAMPGQIVCRTGVRIRVGGTPVDEALLRDSRGRRLPAWSGCRTLLPGEVFLMNPTVRDSFDGRYFGPLPASALLGRAVPIWLAPAGRRPATRPAPTPLHPPETQDHDPDRPLHPHR
jgi:conjugative transfer signal peptidase TraF